MQSVAGASNRSPVRQHLRAHDVCVAAIALELCGCLGCVSSPRCRTGTREFLGLHHAPASSAARVGSGAAGGRRAFFLMLSASVCSSTPLLSGGSQGQQHQNNVPRFQKKLAPADAVPASQHPRASANTIIGTGCVPTWLLSPAGRKEETAAGLAAAEAPCRGGGGRDRTRRGEVDASVPTVALAMPPHRAPIPPLPPLGPFLRRHPPASTRPRSPAATSRSSANRGPLERWELSVVPAGTRGTAFWPRSPGTDPSCWHDAIHSLMMARKVGKSSAAPAASGSSMRCSARSGPSSLLCPVTACRYSTTRHASTVPAAQGGVSGCGATPSLTRGW